MCCVVSEVNCFGNFRVTLASGFPNTFRHNRKGFPATGLHYFSNLGEHYSTRSPRGLCPFLLSYMRSVNYLVDFLNRVNDLRSGNFRFIKCFYDPLAVGCKGEVSVNTWMETSINGVANNFVVTVLVSARLACDRVTFMHGVTKPLRLTIPFG